MSGAPIAPPIALGTLVLVPHPTDPRLLLVIRCVVCKREHVHSWGVDVPASEPTPRAPHCRDAGPHTPQYSVRPAPTAANRAVLREYERRVQAVERGANAAK